MKVLALDLMGVIAVQKKVSFPKQDYKKSDNEWKRLQKTAINKICNGLISERELMQKLELKEEEITKVLDSMILDQDARELIKSAKEKGMTTCLLSDHATRWAKYLLGKFEIELDYLVISEAIKSRKPNKRIYEEVPRVTRAKPEEILFVDDRALNLEAARELGFNCVLMQRDERECFEPSVKRLGEVAGML